MRNRKLAMIAGACIIAAGGAFAQTATVTTTTQQQYDTSQQNHNAAAGAVGGAAVGAAVAGPVGAAVGAVAGAATGVAATPPKKVTTYVVQHPSQEVTLGSEVKVGTVVPSSVTLTAVPNTQYAYVYTNNTPVIVNPHTRKIIKVIN